MSKFLLAAAATVAIAATQTDAQSYQQLYKAKSAQEWQSSEFCTPEFTFSLALIANKHHDQYVLITGTSQANVEECAESWGEELSISNDQGVRDCFITDPNEGNLTFFIEGTNASCPFPPGHECTKAEQWCASKNLEKSSPCPLNGNTTATCDAFSLTGSLLVAGVVAAITTIFL